MPLALANEKDACTGLWKVWIFYDNGEVEVIETMDPNKIPLMF